MNVEDIRAKTEDELKALLLDLRKNQFNARFHEVSVYTLIYWFSIWGSNF